MRGRRLTKRFELWQTTSVSDGFGGAKISDELITSSWAEIKTANANSKFRSTSDGITNATNQIVIKTRKRNDLTYNNLNQYIKYNNEKYIVQNQPYNVGFDNMYIEIIAIKEELKNVDTLTPL